MSFNARKAAHYSPHYQLWQTAKLLLLTFILTLSLAACSSSNKKNKAPEFASAASISVPEGTTATGYTATATDDNQKDTLSFSVSGGADAAQFSIDSASGVLSFVAVTDFINPTDANGDNVYELELTVDDDRKNGTATLTVLVTVTSTNELPAITSAATVSVTEGSTATGYTATATDANGDTLLFSTSGGADQAQFNIDSATGVLSFVAAPDFAAPADANADNDYELQLTVDDGRTGMDVLDVVVTVLEQSSFSLQVTFPTPNANLGGGVAQTTVMGNIVDSGGTPIDLVNIDYVDVGGVLATLDMVNPGRWSVQVPVVDGLNTLALELGLTSGSVVNSSLTLNNLAAHLGFGDSERDSVNNRILLIERSVRGLLSVDLSSGDRTVVSAVGIGSGTDFNSPRGVVHDSANNRALVVDWQRDALIEVDLASGDRSDLSSPSIGIGIVLDGPNAIDFDPANNRVLVPASVNRAIIAVDLATGNRTEVSGPGVGTGPDFGSLQGIALDAASSRAYVSDASLRAIVSVDLANGDRTILSDATTGSGPTMSAPLDSTLDSPNNRLLVADQVWGLFAIDLTSGDRTVLSDPGAEYGRNGSRIQSVTYDAISDTAYVPDSTLDVVFSIDLTNDTRSILSDSSVGSGPVETGMWVMRGIAFDRSRDRLIMPNWDTDTVVAIDLASANRSVLANSSVGTGPVPTFPGKLVVDAENNRAVMTDLNLFGLYAVDLDTGDRTILSDSVSVGSGPVFIAPADVVVDTAANRAVVLDSSLGLLAVDLMTGDRSVVSDSTTGSGPLFGFADGFEIDKSTEIGYVVDDGGKAVYSVDIVTGDRAILSNNTGTGVGPVINFPNDIKLDVANNRALILNRGSFKNLMAVDLTTGDRTILSDASVGSGVDFQSPHYIELDLPNNRAFIYDLAVTGVIVVNLSTGERALASK